MPTYPETRELWLKMTCLPATRRVSAPAPARIRLRPDLSDHRLPNALPAKGASSPNPIRELRLHRSIPSNWSENCQPLSPAEVSLQFETSIHLDAGRWFERCNCACSVQRDGSVGRGVQSRKARRTRRAATRPSVWHASWNPANCRSALPNRDPRPKVDKFIGKQEVNLDPRIHAHVVGDHRHKEIRAE